METWIYELVGKITLVALGVLALSVLLSWLLTAWTMLFPKAPPAPVVVEIDAEEIRRTVFEAMKHFPKPEWLKPKSPGDLYIGYDIGHPHSAFCVVRKLAGGQYEVITEWTKLTPPEPEPTLEDILRVVREHTRGKEPVVVKVSNLRDLNGPCVLDELREAFAGIADKVNEKIDEETKAALMEEKIRATSFDDVLAKEYKTLDEYHTARAGKRLEEARTAERAAARHARWAQEYREKAVALDKAKPEGNDAA